MRPPVDLSSLPESPGIYKMINSSGVVIYIGKAKHLKKRVKQYFMGGRPLDVKTAMMVKQVATIDTIVTQSEQDALLLEAQLIREFQPRYNIQLKDDRHYPYVKLTNEPFPRVLVVRNRESDGSTYFGPFPSLGSTRVLARQLVACFQLRDCSMPIDLVTRQPKCMKLDMGKCLGPCVEKSHYALYHDRLSQLKKVLLGQHKVLIQDLTSQMRQAAHAMRYERAGMIRDLIQKLESIGPRQTVLLDLPGTTSVWGVATQDVTQYVVIQTFVEGRLLYQQGFYDKANEWGNFLPQCLVQYVERHGWPDRLIGDSLVLGHLSDMLQLLPNTIGLTPQRGIKLQVLKMATQNATLALKRILKSPSWATPPIQKESLLEQVKIVLDLHHIPERIIGFDISHLQGQDIVASAVYFKQGVPSKSRYRRFSIRSVVGSSDDPQSIEECVSRRLQHCFVSNEALPNLLLIDGGKAQLNAARRAVDDLGLSSEIELVALAKRQEELYRLEWSQPLGLPDGHPVLKLLQWVRDESHRFANSFQQLKRRKRWRRTILDTVPGLGPVRQQRLLSHFKSITAIQASSESEIARIGQLPPSLAWLIKSTLSGNP